MSKFLKFIVNVFLVVAILTAAAILVPPLLGVNTTIVDTAGMDTNLPLGSVTYSVNVPVTKLQVGDEVLKENGSSTYAYIIEEGDAGTGKYKVASAVDRDSVTEITLRNTVSLVKLSIPYIGYVVVAMQTMEGIIIIVLVVLFIIILFVLSELWKVKDDDDDDTDPNDFLADTDGDEALHAGLAADPDFNEFNPGTESNEEMNVFDPYQADTQPSEPSGIFGEEAPAPNVQEMFGGEENGQPAAEAAPTEGEFHFGEQQPAASAFEAAPEEVPAERFQEAIPLEEASVEWSGEAVTVNEDPAETARTAVESEAAAEPQGWMSTEEAVPETAAPVEAVEAVSEEIVEAPAAPEEIIPDPEEERADFLEPNQFIAVDRLTLEEILEQARQKGGEPEVNRDDISGVNIVDYSKLI